MSGLLYFGGEIDQSRTKKRREVMGYSYCAQRYTTYKTVQYKMLFKPSPRENKAQAMGDDGMDDAEVMAPGMAAMQYLTATTAAVDLVSNSLESFESPSDKGSGDDSPSSF